ncbi:MAG: hypothetical protein HY216_03275 [Candidatus Rokubacteria bacterium]|nr:hypothetical protein [Candidatus Rokubacteria bacterium]
MKEFPGATAVVDALAREGFAEFKREVTQGARGAMPAGGLWQGLDGRTGTVASVIWATGALEDASVFVDVNGAATPSTVAVLAEFARTRDVRVRIDTVDLQPDVSPPLAA